MPKAKPERLRGYIERRILETGAPTIVPRAKHWLCTRGLEAGLIDPRNVWQDYRPGVRDPRKVEAELEILWGRYPKRVKATLEAYLNEKLQKATETIPTERAGQS